MPGGTQDEIQPVLDAKARAEGGDDTFALSSGVILKAKRLPTMLMTDLIMALEQDKPKPPLVLIESKGRKEENPNDPDYLEAVKMHEAKMASIMFNAFVLEGTELLSVPSLSLPSQDDEEWLDRMRILGRPVTTKAERYVAWIKGIACPETSDIAKIMEEVGRRSQVSETDVSAAVTNFRR